MQGLVLGRYRLLARVAQGGMGEVWRGVDVGYGGIERPIALKRINPLLARDAGLRQQFLDEAKLSFLLCHQNVVQVRDIGEAAGDLYIAMEWVEGADLGTLLERLQKQAGQPLPLRFCCLVAVEAARGLDYAHRLRDAGGRWLQLVHRDVSPANLLCSFEGELKVSDFGIARSRLKEQTSIPGTLKGKIGYMAPEQARGELVDARADVFALGAVLYEMVTAHNPFFQDGGSEKEAIDRVRECRFRPLRQVVPTVPQGLEAIVMRAMAPRRDERYATADQMREDLESFARREAYALSASHFGHFLRELFDAAPATAGDEAGGERTPTPVKRLSGSRAVTAPRAFNDALGGALAALGSDDDSADAAEPAAVDPVGRTVPASTIGGEKAGERAAPAVKPRTVALPAMPHKLHAPIKMPSPTTPPPMDVEPPRPETDLDDLVPRNRMSAPMMVAMAVAGVALLGGAMWIARRSSAHASVASTAPATTTPSTIAAKTAPPPVTAPLPGNDRVVPPPAGEREHHKARGPIHGAEAHLTITSDVASDAFVDGNFVRATPIVDLPLPPGHHVVRVEATAAGLRLIPKEQEIELHAGELRELSLELR